MKVQLLLVEDDESLGYILREYLEMNDLHTEWVRHGEEGLEQVKENNYDLYLLDVMMPKMDGFTLAKEIKQVDPETPFLFLTAKTLKVDQLRGFKLGADDYIVKPVDEELLIARIRAILNRTQNRGKKSKQSYSIGRYTFDVEKRELSIDDKTEVLTPREADVLEQLCQYKEQVLTRDHALETVWGKNNYFNRRIMDVYISKLRKYLEADASVSIKNVHGTGFILSENS